MSEIIFFSASKKKFFCRNDVQAIDFLRKGSYAPVKNPVRLTVSSYSVHQLADINTIYL